MNHECSVSKWFLPLFASVQAQECSRGCCKYSVLDDCGLLNLAIVFQEGVLLGKVCSHKVNNITDSQSAGCKEETKVCLHSFVSFDRKYRSVSRSVVALM